MEKEQLRAIESLMSEEDKLELRSIFEPKEVCVLPKDACRQIAVCPDGEIRLYGREDNPLEHWTGDPIYLASRDGGLSWKKHRVTNPAVLKAAAKNPKSGRYITTLFVTEDSGTHSGTTYALLSDEGFDSDNIRRIKLADFPIHVSHHPYFVEELDRWFITGEYTDKEHIKRITVSISDDDGEHFRTQVLEKYAPYYEQKPPHKGIRWQQYSCEPSLVYIPEESLLLMYVRTSADYHYEYRSYDGGESWQGPVPTPFHAVNTMPILYRLSDGRLLHLWTNSHPLAELDHSEAFPPLDEDVKSGVWEDVFTNRDVNCIAISEDNGKSFIHSRELWRNGVRNRSDFRSVGGFNTLDKSVHQGEMLELPFGKVLVTFGQNKVSRRAVIFDINWLYETEAREDFRLGLEGVSTHMFVRSVLGGFHHFSGHCAYNRTNGALLIPDPDGNYEEVLQLCYLDDPRLVDKKQGVVWGFPAAKQGEVQIHLRVLTRGVRISLLDAWAHPADENVRDHAHISFDYDTVTKSNEWDTITVRYDTEQATYRVLCNSLLLAEGKICGSCPLGLLYLHLQTLADARDTEGTLIKSLYKK